MRAVLDPNVLIAAMLSPRGTPAAIIRRWVDGEFELVVSRSLLDELERALTYPKLRARIASADAAEFVAELREAAELRDDPGGDPPVRPSDPGDEYLVSLAAAVRAVIVTGNRALLDLAGRVPVYSPSDFLAVLVSQDE